MQKITTIDLWLPDEKHRAEIYDKVFRAGFDADRAYSNKAVTTSYDKVEIYQNCNIGLETSDFPNPIDYRHIAILFYKDGQPIRLLADNASPDEVNKLYYHALVQRLGPSGRYSLQEILDNIEVTTIDLKRPPLCHDCKTMDDPQIASCNRWDLFLQFIDNMKDEQAEYHFDPFSYLEVNGQVGDWELAIPHRTMFFNTEKQHYITLQSASPLIP